MTHPLEPHLDKFERSSKPGKFNCPACGGNNLSVNATTFAHECYDNGCTARQILDVIAPLQPNDRPMVSRQILKKATIEAPIPQGLCLEIPRLADIPSDIPKPFKRKDHKHGEVLITRYPYSNSQHAERKQWDDATKPKGYDKDFHPYHRKGDQVVCGKGTEAWGAYRLEEAIAASIASGSKLILSQEGETCVELGRSHCIPSFTFQGGSWSGSDVAVVAARIKAEGMVWVHIEDNDAAGQTKAQKLKEKCAEAKVPFIAIPITSICPEVPEKGDLKECLELVDVETFVSLLSKAIQSAIAMPSPNAKAEVGSEPRQVGETIALPSLSAEPCDPYRLTDAAATLDHHLNIHLFKQGTGAYIVMEGAFFWWNNNLGVWENQPDDIIRRLVADESKKVYASRIVKNGDGFEERKTFKYATHRNVTSAIGYNRDQLAISNSERTYNESLINFTNGVLDVGTGEFRAEHRRNDYLTHQIQSQFQPGSECPEAFLEFVKTCYGLDQLDTIQAVVRYYIDFTLPYGKFVHLAGKSGTGKGVLLRFLSDLHGSFAKGLGEDFEAVSKAETRHQYLTGTRIGAFPDISSSIGKLGAFYELVDNGSLTGRPLFSSSGYQKRWNVRFLTASTQEIQFEDSSRGWERRCFPLQTLDRQGVENPDLEAGVQACIGEVVSWAMSMERSRVQEILWQTTPQTQELRDAQAIASDSVASFIDFCLAPDNQGVPISKAILYRQYAAYCAATGLKPKGYMRFCTVMKASLGNRFETGRSSRIVDGSKVNVPACFSGFKPINRLFTPRNAGSTIENSEYDCNLKHLSEGGLGLFREAIAPTVKEVEPEQALATAEQPESIKWQPKIGDKAWIWQSEINAWQKGEITALPDRSNNRWIAMIESSGIECNVYNISHLSRFETVATA
ncbi:MAG: hypothetical protein KME11_12555 [Timaviella obliquedivisa GSE-PSE-MK23-08B]|jgi:hypothetical protein|nr:hypothetical protein [Timaviella obliquedivisa GSE-PSE-MK23-08B]